MAYSQSEPYPIQRAVSYALPVMVLTTWIFFPHVVTNTVNKAREILTTEPVVTYEAQVNAWLESIGIPPPYPSAVQVAFVASGAAITLVIYFLYIRRRRIRMRGSLERDLAEALQQVQELRTELSEITEEEAAETRGGKKNVRIFMEGAFDLMHYGHMNAFRLGSKLGTTLIVGVNSSDSIEKCKGFPPVMSDEERCSAVRSCRFVDEVVEKTPYVMTPEYLAWIMKEYDIDFVVHGNDPCIVDGRDVYEEPKRLGKYRSIPRTEGVSTTDFVGRMLLCSALHHMRSENERPSSPSGLRDSQRVSQMDDSSNSLADFTYEASSRFHTTSSILMEFSKGIRSPPEGARIVYMDGAWDMFHAGHMDVMKKAREQGDYLVVGVLSDDLINKHRGLNYPILNLNERVLSVLGCKYVDDVVIDCPWEIDEDMMASLNIHVVVHGTTHDSSTASHRDYSVAKRMGKFKEVTSTFTLTVSEVVSRIGKSREQYLKKFKSKQQKEKEYYDERYGRDGEKEEDKKTK
uniref:ethanolamine-phosphate cytidylyltransferase n=1 Tax=Paramoeba aestuarina TaxID=180227 RepID=A0A7S4NZ07_9EUKA|eukprot:CAMPEP_0201507152 /NCGR_PEP_ID=MMETSP0161_2-20130828/895_1 /ASSEMBLY_ACC=CAM_ASM_000251 /TAXON_ID=180227 /ORGANISM="Neoparamoeba aestuarina, Strain SoJaBio B1-5/56/2" /LENGTH=517 /DNA_ID=CAMNT_0047901443 /DNA_START=116 /DNA_END=1669 /DNA_ORIENTATION=+